MPFDCAYCLSLSLSIGCGLKKLVGTFDMLLCIFMTLSSKRWTLLKVSSMPGLCVHVVAPPLHWLDMTLLPGIFCACD